MTAEVRKLQPRLLDSSLMELPMLSRWTFVALLLAADKKGRVLGVDGRLAQRIGVSLEEFRAAIDNLSAPDPGSSSKAEEGRRVVPLGEVNGYRIVNFLTHQGGKAATKNLDPAKCPTTPESKAIAAIFRRRAETEWEPNEIASFKSLMRRGVVQLEDLTLIHRYYEAERRRVDEHGKQIGIHRRKLDTFLNNYTGELDKAREWAARNPKTAAKALSDPARPKTAEPEPEGFRAWLIATYPQADQAQPWEKIPPDIRRQFTP